MEPVDSAQLGERVRVVVDAQVDERVGEARVAAVALDDEQRRGLAAAAVAARALRRIEAVEQPLRERVTGRRLERPRERVDGGFGDEDVPLRGVAVTRAATGPGVAPVAGERGGASLAVHDAELA